MTRLVLIGFVPEDQERLAPLVEALEARGLPLDWWTERPNRLAWINDLQPRILTASGVLAVWTQASARDRWSAVVADEALECRTLVSVVLDPVPVPPAFRGVPPVDLIGWDGGAGAAGMDRLVAVLARLLGLPPGLETVPPRRSPESLSGEDVTTAGFRGGVSPSVLQVLLHPAAFPRSGGRPGFGPEVPESPGREAALGLMPPASAGRSASPSAPAVPPCPAVGPAVLLPLSRTAGDLERAWGFVSCGYGWALAWALGLTAMGFYLLPAAGVTDVARVYIGNPALSAGEGAAVGLVGAVFMLFTLVREQLGVSPVQVGVIAAAWVLGGAVGLLAAAWFDVPVIGVTEGLVGFDLGWVLCWLIAAGVGGLGTWLALRTSHSVDHRSLVLIVAGFALGDLGGWLLGWLLVAVPILPLGWLIGSVLPAGHLRELLVLGLEITSLGLTGLIGGAGFGLGGGLVLVGSLGGGGTVRRAARAPEPAITVPGEGD
jgi:hypothetical protein